MKYIYVLASSPTDTYYEQFFLSITSLRMYNPGADCIVLTDEKTKDNLIGKRTGYEKIVSEVKIIRIVDALSQKENSRWIKTSIRQYVSGDFLFIDCDTIITGKLDYDLPSDIQIGAVLDTHIPFSKHYLCNDFQKRNKIAGFQTSGKIDAHYNSGIIFCRDTDEMRHFFEQWHSLWRQGNKKGISSDQGAFNQVNDVLDGIITELPGEWNCQISHNGLPYLHNAKIIHYYATSLVSFVPAYKLASPEILASIKASGEIPAEALRLLENPKAAFENHSRIIADPAVIEAFDGSLFSKLIWLNKSHPKLFRKCDNFMSGLTKIVKKIIGKE